MVNATDFKFDTRVPRHILDMTPKNFSETGCGQSVDTLNFLALNSNSSKTVKAMVFKLDTRVPRDSPDMTPRIFPKGGVARVT